MNAPVRAPEIARRRPNRDLFRRPCLGARSHSPGSGGSLALAPGYSPSPFGRSRSVSGPYASAATSTATSIRIR
jgi:hypothetical protein